MRRRTVALILTVALATPAHAGYRNLLLSLPELPPDGYRPGATVTVHVATTWEQRPLPHRAVWVRLGVPQPSAQHTLTQGWIYRTDHQGEATVYVELLDTALPGPWLVQAWLLEPLPDGTGDGDGISFPVTAATP